MPDTAKAAYERLKVDREPFLERARDNAEYTIPTLFPPEGHNGHDTLRQPNQNFASGAVNTLSAKMVMGLFPAGVPIFKQRVPKRIQLEMTANNPAAFQEITRMLGMIEMEATDEMESKGWRPVLHAAMRNLTAGGNYLIHYTPDGTLQGFNLGQYVVRRDPRGNVLEIVVMEEVAIDTLPEGTAKLVEARIGVEGHPKSTSRIHGPVKYDPTIVPVYTHITRKGKHFEIRQEVMGMTVEGSEGKYPLNKSPWMPIRWLAIEGEHYGRSMVEDYLSDIIALDVISKGIKEAVALGVRTVFLKRPGSATKIKDLKEAENGDVIVGSEDDIGTLKLDKQIDLSIAERWAERLEQRLGKAFLLNTAVQRNGERVTLGEIRFMINELNDALGGVYAVLAQELQKPLIIYHIHSMEKANKLPRIPDQDVNTTLVTGMDALSREHDLQNLQQAAQIIQGMFGPDAAMRYLNPDDVMRRIFTNLRIDPDGALKTPEQIAEDQQMEQMRALVERLGPNAINAISQQAAAGTGTPQG